MKRSFKHPASFSSLESAMPEKQLQAMAVRYMGHTTWFPDEVRDLIIGLLAVVLGLLIWAAVITPAAI